MAIADDYEAIQKRRLELGGDRWPPHNGNPPKPKEPEPQTPQYFYGFGGPYIPCP